MDEEAGKAHPGQVPRGSWPLAPSYVVRHVTCAQLVNELVEAADDRRLSRIVTRYDRLDRPCLDQLGYMQLD